MDNLKSSITKKGFLLGNEEWGGKISGRLLIHETGDFRITIFEGNHRTSVLAHLGWKLIPLQTLFNYPPVRLRDLEEWPGVVDGSFSAATAREFFEAFFRPRHQRLLPGWP